MNDKLGKAGRFYSLTPKAHEFIEALEKWCAERDIAKDEIPKLLQHASRARVRQKTTPWRKRARIELESLVEKGYLKEEAWA